VTAVALPLVAVVQLHASAFEVGMITSAEFFAYAGLGLVAGVYVDRWKRRTVMLATDATRAVVVATVPLLAFAGLLRIWHLYAVALVLGVLSLFFDTASQAYLPTILPRDKLVGGNSRLQASASVTQLGGPGLAGVLVQVLGAANTLLTHAVGLVASFLSVLAIRGKAETHFGAGRAEGAVASETIASRIVEGFRYVRQDPILVGVLATTAHFNLLITAEEALRVVFLVRSVHASPALIGLLLSAGGAGAMLGAVFAERLTSWLGIGKTLLLGASIGPALGVLIPFTHLDATLLFFILGTAGLGATTTILKVVGTSYRQAMVPPHLLGRVVATMRTLTWGPLPLAGLLGGGIGQLLGPRPGFLVLALLMLPAPLWLLRTPLWKVRDFHELAA
jgi:MFS family permease